MSAHRRGVRPRYGRIAALATSLTVSAVAALAGLGVLVSGPPSAGASALPASYTHPASPPSVAPSDGVGSHDASTTRASSESPGMQSAKGISSTTDRTAVPSDSGSGRRIVFSQHLQRVWLVGAAHDTVKRTYLVSGSLTHNLVPGTYSVYSRQRWAVGIDDSGVMQYFVRFTQGPTGAAIGFHTIPTKNHVPLQTKAQLGTPQSHGCIRQATPDAIALWNFAPVGTKVVVVA